MTTDNRGSEPTEAQVEAAAKAVREVDARAGLIADVDLPMYRARAALAAAAGVAPQAESVERANLIGRLTGSVNPLSVTCGECGSKPGKRCYGNGEMRRPHPSRETKAERELMIEAAEALAAQVQPSSTVDEAALIREAKAEALEEASLAYGSGQLSGIFLGRDDYPKAWLRARATEYREGIET